MDLISKNEWYPALKARVEEKLTTANLKTNELATHFRGARGSMVFVAVYSSQRTSKSVWKKLDELEKIISRLAASVTRRSSSKPKNSAIDRLAQK